MSDINGGGFDEQLGTGASRVPLKVDLDTNGASSKLSGLIALVAQLESKLSSIGNASGFSQLSSQMANTANSASQLQKSMPAGVASGANWQSSARAGAIKAQREIVSARQTLERLSSPLGAGHSRSQIHAHHAAMISAKSDLRRATVEAQDYAQMGTQGNDKWLRQAASAKAKMDSQLAQGVPEAVAEQTYNARISQIRADRQAAHEKAVAQQGSKRDDLEQEQYRSGQISASDYQAYLKSRLTDPQVGSQEDTVISSRLDKLIEVGNRANDIARTRLAEFASNGTDRGKDAIARQSQELLNKGADPGLVAQWQTAATGALDNKESAQATRKADFAERLDYQNGTTSGADYLAYLKQRLASTTTGTSDWNHLTSEIESMNKTIENQAIRSTEQDYRSGNISAQAYKDRLTQIMQDSGTGSSGYDTAQRAIDKLVPRSNSDQEWGERIGDTVGEVMARRLEEMLSRSITRRHHRGGILSDTGDALTSGAVAGGGSILRNWVSEFSKTALTSISQIFHRSSKVDVSGASGSTDIKRNASEVFQALHGGILQLAVDAQAFAALSGVEGKKRQKHSALGGVLGGILGSFGVDWFGGAQIGASIGGMFASGGNPPVGIPSIVGEKGPELFVPRSSGTILPNNTLSGLGGGQTNMKVTVNHYGDVNNQGDIQNFHETIADAIMRRLAVASPMVGTPALG